MKVNQRKNNRILFDLFKSNVCHRLKELGDVSFLLEVYQNNEIDKYYKKKWYPECLYLLAMVDYLSRINNVKLSSNYNELRKMKLKEIIYPNSILVYSLYDKDIMKKAYDDSIEEFKRFNIVEREIRDVA